MISTSNDIGWRASAKSLQDDIRGFTVSGMIAARSKPFRFSDGSCYWSVEEAMSRLEEHNGRQMVPIARVADNN